LSSTKTSEDWHTLEYDTVMERLGTTEDGLSDNEVKLRQEKYGFNELTAGRRVTPLEILLNQFKDIFVIMLLVAVGFSIIVGYYEAAQHPGPSSLVEDYADAIVIGAIVLMNAFVGFIQEYRSEKALEAMQKLTAPTANVIREGEEITINARELVPGDILMLESGDRIATDARLFEVVNLQTDEAPLTGESTPVSKLITPLKVDIAVGDRKNMVFMATHTTYGRGKGVVTSTGMSTEFGKIAEAVQEAEEVETPLKRKLAAFAKRLAIIVIVLCIIIFILGALEGGFGIEPIIRSFMTAVALAVSVVPEALPAIVTVTLAFGARDLARQNAVIRRLSSAETLGSTTVICSDKTGTLTKGEMTVRQLYINDKIFDVSGVGYEPIGNVSVNGEEINPAEEAGMELLLRIGSLCSNVRLTRDDSGRWTIRGDPTEGALLVAAEKMGIGQDTIENEYPRLHEIPFSSERKRMTTVHVEPSGDKVAYLKGAPEIVLERSTHIFREGREEILSDDKKKEILTFNEKMAGNALRVLGMAYKKLPEVISDFDEEVIEKNLVFVGLEGMIDPPRDEAIAANTVCEKAGIKTVMITGDHKLTAMAVSKEIGILKEGNLSLEGRELDNITDEDFDNMVEDVTVYARVSPQHKLRIVKALKNKGHIVAMTGDGVNDAPAIKNADIGVGMGITGTDVTKEASDMVLADDNFATIVTAVHGGRVIYDNIRKYIRLLLSSNFDEVLVIGSFAILGGIFGEEAFPLPLTAAMILWINLVTDGAPALALTMDPPMKGVMDRPPRDPQSGVLHGMLMFIIVTFCLQSLSTIVVFSLEYYVWGSTLQRARTVAFMQACIMSYS
jgi:Ca2+-transporting ATPase